MRKFFAIVVLLGAILLTFGTCNSMCGGGSSGCDLGCSNGCSTGCSSGGCDLDTETKYNGDITLKIHTYDGQIITVTGHRDEDVEGYIVSQEETDKYLSIIKNYSMSTRPGYYFEGLYYVKGTEYCYIFEKYNLTQYSVNRSNLRKIKDGAVIDVYENWKENEFLVEYRVKGKHFDIHGYSYGDMVEIPSEVTEYINNLNNPKEVLAGWKIVGSDWNSGYEEKEWTLGLFDANKEALYEGHYYGLLKVEAVFESVKVNVKFHYDFESKPAEVKKVYYDENLSGYFKQRSSSETEEGVEFIGWYLDEARTQKFNGEFDSLYQTETLNLYAKWKYYKTVKIDFKKNIGVKTCKVYEDNTLSLSLPTDIYGVSESMETISRINDYYSTMEEGKTYYVVYLSV